MPLTVLLVRRGARQATPDQRRILRSVLASGEERVAKRGLQQRLHRVPPVRLNDATKVRVTDGRLTRVGQAAQDGIIRVMDQHPTTFQAGPQRFDVDLPP